MSFLSVLYTLIISPLELLFEVIFSVSDRLIGNSGLSIIVLSIAINFLVLPLYKRADELQAEERDIQAKMAYRIKRTRETFKGDERFFMLQEYYRINNYKPVYALKSSASLLLQIPFFIAAYRLLSGMQSLKGMPFGFITDLGKEDATFMISSFPVNILPILMTLINVVTGIIYTKGQPLKSKIQVYGLAAVFLILLYRSPSGLVFYWLLNNVFSLVKNIFYKLKDPKKALHIVMAVAGVAIIVLSLISAGLDARQKVLLVLGGISLLLPLISGFIKNKYKKSISAKGKKNNVVFFAGTVLLSLIIGLLIPSTVITASVTEFIDMFQIANPIKYVINTLLLSLGSCVLWGGVYYFFMSDKLKALFCKAIWIICAVSVTDYMLFGKKLGNISSTLQYDVPPGFTIKNYMLNIAAVIVVIVVFSLIYAYNDNITKTILFIGILAVSGLGILNSAEILGTYSGYLAYTKPSVEMPTIPLSKNGNNVIVIMLDRAMGTQVPYVFNEKPELKEKFDGFTYYPNTISFSTRTIMASPALFGGYEYTPDKINERSNESLANKHNEALKVMPVLFGENNYTVTVCDPPYAGYKIISDLSIYDDHPEFNCYTTLGALNYFESKNSGIASINVSARANQIRNRNFFFFSLMKISPLILQETIYDGGLYNESASQDGIIQTYSGYSKSFGYNLDFLNAYAVLKNLSQITEIDNSGKNTFLMLTNETTHSPSLLQEPDYVPAARVDNTPYDINMTDRYTLNGITMEMSSIDQVRHYHANVAAYQELAKWFDYLRANGVYDNTRIILVSDHGRDLNQLKINCGNQNLECFMPLLMVKDFNAKGFTVSEEFMTNGDTPTLATAGLIKDPVNPFTGKALNSSAKKLPLTVTVSDVLNPFEVSGNTFPLSRKFTLTGNNPYKSENWKRLD